MNDDELEVWAKKENPKAMAHIQELMQALFPGFKYSISIEDNAVKMDGFDLIPCLMDIPSIRGDIQVPGYELTGYKMVYGGYWEPDDIDIIPIDRYRNTQSACAALVNRVISNTIEIWQENKGIEEMLREELIEPEYLDVGPYTNH